MSSAAFLTDKQYSFLLPFMIECFGPKVGKVLRLALLPNSFYPLIGGGCLPLYELKSGPKGATYLGLDCRNASAVRPCVIKKALSQSPADVYGRNAQSRLRHEERILRSIRGKINAPTAYISFDHENASYLVTEYIQGHSAESLRTPDWSIAGPSARALLKQRFRLIIRQVSDLHSLGYVHRDLSLGNIRFSNDNEAAYLLDFDLAFCSAHGEPHFYGGLPGLQSPQQRYGLPPTVYDDCYSLSALFLSLTLGLSAKDLLLDCYDLEAIRHLCALRRLSPGLTEVLLRGVSHLAADRCTLQELDFALAEAATLQSHEYNEAKLASTPGKAHNTNTILEAALDELCSCTLPYLGDRRRPDTSTADPRLSQGQRLSKGFGNGLSGILYVLSLAHHRSYHHPRLRDRAEELVRFLLPSQPQTKVQENAIPGLYFGQTGVSLALQAAFGSGLCNNFDCSVAVLPTLNSFAGHSYSGGLSGLGFACLQLGIGWALDDAKQRARDCANALLSSQLENGGWYESPSAMADLSFATGVAGVVSFLSRYGLSSDDASIRAACQKAGVWLLSHSSHSTASHPNTRRRTREVEISWGSGSAGVALSLLSLYQLTHDPLYSQACQMLLPLPSTMAVLRRSTGLAQGLAGLAAIYSDAATLLSKDDLRETAMTCYQLLCDAAVKTQNGVSWPTYYSQPCSASLLAGSAGIIYSLFRQQAASPALFPLLSS